VAHFKKPAHQGLHAPDVISLFTNYHVQDKSFRITTFIFS